MHGNIYAHIYVHDSSYEKKLSSRFYLSKFIERLSNIAVLTTCRKSVELPEQALNSNETFILLFIHLFTRKNNVKMDSVSFSNFPCVRKYCVKYCERQKIMSGGPGICSYVELRGVPLKSSVGLVKEENEIWQNESQQVLWCSG